MARKTRTREHIIADYSGIHFERYALECGFSVERISHDDGIDMLLYTYNRNGEIENEEIKIQLKATDAPDYLRRSNEISVEVECADLESWLDELMPVVLVLYDAKQKIAYWLHVQAYFEDILFDPRTAEKTMRVRISKTNVLDAASVRQFAQWKNEAHRRLKGA